MGRMIKALACCATLTIAVSAPAHGGPRERTENVPYEKPGAQVADQLYVEVTGSPETQPAAGERYVSVKLEDASGRPVAGVVHQGDQEIGRFCGATDEPLRLVSRKSVHVHVFVGTGCSDVSVATQGTVEFTFTR